MFTKREMAECVLWYDQSNSATAVQRKYRSKYKTKKSPHVKSIKKWHMNFKADGVMTGRKKSGKKPIQDNTVDQIAEYFNTNPKSSIRLASNLSIPKTTVHRVARNVLKLFPYRIRTLQALHENDYHARELFGRTLLTRVSGNPAYLNNICFSDEATFHLSGTVSRQNSRIWASHNPYEFIELERNSPKLNMWCGLLFNRVIGPFFFAEQTVNSINYLDMLENFVFIQLEEFQPNIIFQQDGAPPHWGLGVRQALNRQYPDRWIGCDGLQDHRTLPLLIFCSGDLLKTLCTTRRCGILTTWDDESMMLLHLSQRRCWKTLGRSWNVALIS